MLTLTVVKAVFDSPIKNSSLRKNMIAKHVYRNILFKREGNNVLRIDMVTRL